MHAGILKSEDYAGTSYIDGNWDLEYCVAETKLSIEGNDMAEDAFDKYLGEINKVFGMLNTDFTDKGNFFNGVVVRIYIWFGENR